MGTTLLEQGLTLMLAGMGTVFLFLTTLVIAMTLMSKVAKRWVPAAEGGDDDARLAAITAAVHHHNTLNQERHKS